MTDTIFDKILRQEIPCQKVYEDDYAFAFHDINPQAPVHVLVIPKTKIEGFNHLADLDSSFLGEYMKSITKVVNQLNLSADGYRIVFNSGKNGQQTVDYMHAHILGKRQLKWPPG